MLRSFLAVLFRALAELLKLEDYVPFFSLVTFHQGDRILFILVGGLSNMSTHNNIIKTGWSLGRGLL